MLIPKIWMLSHATQCHFQNSKLFFPFLSSLLPLSLLFYFSLLFKQNENQARLLFLVFLKLYSYLWTCALSMLNAFPSFVNFHTNSKCFVVASANTIHNLMFLLWWIDVPWCTPWWIFGVHDGHFPNIGSFLVLIFFLFLSFPWCYSSPWCNCWWIEHSAFFLSSRQSSFWC